MKLQFDEIGLWTEIKLDIIGKYASAYSTALANKFYYIYIDAFAGPGTHISRTTRGQVPGSPQIVLDIKPRFDEYYFIDLNVEKIAHLQEKVSHYPQAHTHIFNQDCNEVLLTKILPTIKYDSYIKSKGYMRGLCLLDPYGLNLKWDVIYTAGHNKSIDMILNFPVMAMNRNVLWSNPDGVDESDILRMNVFWGDDSWRSMAYRQVENLFGETLNIKEDNRTVAAVFRKRLIDVAGFNYVPKPIPMRNSKGGIIYYLFIASHNSLANKIASEIINKYV